MLKKSSVVVSNGFNKFSLADGASETYKRGELALFLTGAYPFAGLQRVFQAIGLQSNRKLGRLFARQTSVPDRLVRSFWTGEILHALGVALMPNRGHDDTLRRALAGRLIVLAFQWYARSASKVLGGLGANIYLYRSGFGGPSVKAAKQSGMIALCYHSIAHPDVLAYVMRHGGRLPAPGEKVELSCELPLILEDLNASDFVVVQGNFVKETFLNRGWPEDRLFTILQGIDDQFLELLDSSTRADPQPTPQPTGPLKMAYAGSGERKGIRFVLEALAQLSDPNWTIKLYGTIPDDIQAEHMGMLADPRVESLGMRPRREVAESLLDAEVFLLPSFAEGSAKAAFEALAAACYMICTPNTGSIVRDGIHGQLVPAGESQPIASAIEHCLASREAVREIGAKNRATVLREHRQVGFGEQLGKIYETVLSAR